MRLNPVPARTGLSWVRLGIRTFVRQPLGLALPFLLFIVVLTLLARVPLIGDALTLALLPTVTLGMMAATREADGGRFPRPGVFLVALLSGREQRRAALTLGAIYAGAFLGLLAVSALFDGGQFAHFYLGGGAVTPEVAQSDEFQRAMWVGSLLYLPLSLLFWHAPALVHWQQVSPLKSLFFSLMACWQNKGALLLFMLAWVGVFLGAGVVVSIVAVLLGIGGTGLLYGAAPLLAAMFFTSFYFSFRDSFVTDEGQPPA